MRLLALTLELLNVCCWVGLDSLLRRVKPNTSRLLATTASENVSVTIPSFRSSVKFRRDGEVVSGSKSVVCIALPLVIASTSTPKGSSIVLA